MKNQLNISLLQADLVWEDIEANLTNLDRMIQEVPVETDLVVLPETFSTGFTMESEKFAETLDGKAVSWMKEIASKLNTYITGSLIIRDNQKIFNRLYWVSPKGVEGHYDKRHLFRLGREDEHFIPGNQRKIFKLGEFRILTQICYDLRFPVFARNRDDYDVLLNVANWPAQRQQVWDVLTRARAIENQCYFLGITRAGTDGLGTVHTGGTCAIDPMGSIMQKLDKHPGILNCTLDLGKLRDYREKFPVWKDADRFDIKL
jgi:predicted amidohydrolase